MTIHTADGQTIADIAEIYGVNARELAALNGISGDGMTLPDGMAVIVLIPETTHTVAEGDSLYTIANMHNTTVRALLRNNPWLSLEKPLIIGQNVNVFYEGSKDGSTEAYSYAYPFINHSVYRSILPFLTRIAPFTYGFMRDGTLIEPDDAWMIEDALKYDTAPMMHVSTLNEAEMFDSGLAVSVLSNTQVQQTLADNIIANMKRKGYTALDIDFEFIPPEYAYNYYSFILYLSDRLNPMGYDVIVALAPKTSAEQKGLLYEAHNYELLGRAANGVLLMTYEWGYSAGPPMAVSPINKVREVLDYAVTAIPREKIYLGFSLYGYDWTLPYFKGNDPARSLSPEEAVMLAYAKDAVIQYSVAAESPFFYYNEGSAAHEVWFEDARSVNARLSLVSEYGLRGAGFWHAGRGAAQCWQTLNSRFDIITL